VLADPLFKPLARVGASVTGTVPLTFNNKPLHVPLCASVAAALFAAGVRRFRESPVSGGGRAPYCMMGTCFECLLDIDGVPNRQACMVPLKAGMVIRTQDGARDLPVEVGIRFDGSVQALKVPRGG
jgi:D-hydroxyproline dehydrogenase subunit gamma